MGCLITSYLCVPDYAVPCLRSVQTNRYIKAGYSRKTTRQAKFSGASDSLEHPGCWFPGGGATVASERGQIRAQSVSKKLIIKLPSAPFYSHNAYTPHKFIALIEIILEMPNAWLTVSSAKAWTILPSQETRLITMHLLVKQHITSPFSTPMTFADPCKQVHDTYPRPANA